MCEAAVMSGHTYTHTHTHTHDNYYNPRCAHAHRGLIIIIMSNVCGNNYNYTKAQCRTLYSYIIIKKF